MLSIAYVTGLSFSVIILLIFSFFSLYFMGCLPGSLDYNVKYICRDCCGDDVNLGEHEAEQIIQGYNTVLKEITLSDGLTISGDDYELVNPDETRRTLKEQYETSKHCLIGKQLNCIAISEDFFHKCKQWCEDNPQHRHEDREDAPRYEELFEHVDKILMGMTVEEADPEHDILSQYRSSLANNLVLEFDPSDTEARREAVVMMCRCGDMPYHQAEYSIQAAIKLQCKALASDLASSITDSKSQENAIQRVAAAGATWYQASKYVAEAKRGEHIDKPEKMKNRDFGIETIDLNRQRRKRYVVLKEWWEANLVYLIKSMRKNPLLSSYLDAIESESATDSIEETMGVVMNVLPDMLVGNLEDYFLFSPYVKRLGMFYEDLRRLTDNFLDVQNRWGVYLQLSNSTTQIDNSKTQRRLREQVRHEMTVALGNLIQDGVDGNDRDEVHKLLHEMETVDIQTDEYVHRLEDNLKEIAEHEFEQTEGLKKQIEQQQKMMQRMESVTGGLKKNAEQLRGIINTQERIKYASGFVLLATVVACILLLFQDQIFGSS